MLIPVDEALRALIDVARPTTKTEHLPLQSSLGRVLAEDVMSRINVPPADNSAMDGYAVRLADVEIGKPITIGQRIPAGTSPKLLMPNEVARLFTGANIPAGADTVIMQENAVETDDGSQVSFSAIPDATGTNIRRAGEDIKAGSRILQKGTRLRPQELGLIASVGIDALETFAPLRVAVLSTGSELLEPGAPLQAGKIYNSNRPMLLSLLQSLGFQTLDLGICEDTLASTVAALENAAEQADVIITSGGVSVGEEDHIKTAVETLGSIDLWKVAIKPGKPFAFGKVRGKPLLGLPGNPASVFTTFLVLARPYLLRSQGKSDIRPPILKVPAGFARKPVRRREYLRVKNDNGRLTLFPHQGSGVLTSACWASGFAVQDIGQGITEGQSIDYISFASLLS